MGWIASFVLVMLSGLALWHFGRMSRSALELTGAALLIGMAGYAWQGSPDLPGRPTPPPGARSVSDSAFAQLRGSMMERMGQDARVLDTADAFHRQGLDGYSVGIIKGALEHRPKSADLWTGLGYALVLYNQGIMSPAARLAFARAQSNAPDSPGPLFFLGLALAQGGQEDQAAEVWHRLLANAPAGAPWRGEVARRLAEMESR